MMEFICSKCGAKMRKMTQIHYYEDVTDALGVKLTDIKRKANLCKGCYTQYKRLNLDIQDFMDIPEKELSFLESTFSVGDEVITSTGKVGTIVDICTCNRCKERGFYEPKVEIKLGNDTIYITDNDKRTGFRSFYKIGNHIYGNIDKESLAYDIQRINAEILDLSQQRIELEAQRDVIEHYERIGREGGSNGLR